MSRNNNSLQDGDAVAARFKQLLDEASTGKGPNDHFGLTLVSLYSACDMLLQVTDADWKAANDKLYRYLTTDLGCNESIAVCAEVTDIVTQLGIEQWLARLSFQSGHLKVKAVRRVADVLQHVYDVVAIERTRRPLARMYHLMRSWRLLMLEVPSEGLPLSQGYQLIAQLPLESQKLEICMANLRK